MYIVLISVVLGCIGAIMGSFAAAQVWRLRIRQLEEDKKAGEAYDKKEYARLKPLLAHKKRYDRSIDLDTGTQLPWYDLLPIVSWIWLRGKSRFSGKPIGRMELIAEVGMAVFFVGSFLVWPFALETPLAITSFVIWLIAGVALGILWMYDARWFLLPNKVTYTVCILGLITAVITVIQSQDSLNAIGSIVGAVGIMSGLYLALYVVSRGKWIGFGDVKLGLGLGLLLSDWALAFVALFAANLIGTLSVLPAMMKGSVKRGAHVPFGPFLIVGTVVAKLFGAAIIVWYFSLFSL